jgi:hypothetical protein
MSAAPTISVKRAGCGTGEGWFCYVRPQGTGRQSIAQPLRTHEGKIARFATEGEGLRAGDAIVTGKTIIGVKS